MSATASPAAAATPTSAAAAAVAAASTPASAAAASAIFTRPGFVHGEGASVHGLAVELGDRPRGILVGAHGDEGESARFTCEFILHEDNLLHRPDLREEVLKLGFSRIEREIAYV